MNDKFTASHPDKGAGRESLQSWVVLVAVSLALVVTAGIRSSFGLFLIPLTYEFDWSRTDFSAVIAVSTLLLGVTQPLMGRMVDRSGPKAALLWALGFFAVGLAVTPLTQHLWFFYLSFGVLVGIGTGSSSLAPNSALVGQWFDKHRGFAMGIVGAAMAAGQVVMVPVISWMLTAGWRTTSLYLAGILLVLVLPVLGFIRSPKDVAAKAKETPSWSQIREYMMTPDFVLLAFGFVVCGFSEAFVAIHLPASAHDHGQSTTLAASSLMLIGLAGVLGAVLAGWLSDRWGRRLPLALIYFVRAAGIPALVFIQDPRLLVVGSVLVGLTWKSNAALISAVLGDKYGMRAVGTLFGMQFLLHQLGGSAGTYLGGLIYDLTDTYVPVIMLSSGLLIISGFATLGVREKGVVVAPATSSAARG
jgi:MFS family permease